MAHVDGMRAFAVGLVIAMHAGLTRVPGDGGVTIFFVISGFVITGVLLKERDRTGSFDLRGFYWRRLVKLGPPFLLVVAAPSLIFGEVGIPRLQAVLSQTLFSYNWAQVLRPDIADAALPGTSVVWSLAVEEQFYIGFALLWLFVVRGKSATTSLLWGGAFVACASFVVRVYLASTGGNEYHLTHGTDSRMEAIALGVMLSAWVVRRGPEAVRRTAVARRGQTFLLLALLVFALSSVLFRDPWSEPVLRPTVQALCGVVMILAGLGTAETESARSQWLHRMIRTRPVQIVGLASYSIYLVHFVLIKAVDLSFLSAFPEQFVVRVAMSVGAGVILYYIVEKPVSRYRGVVGRR